MAAEDDRLAEFIEKAKECTCGLDAFRNRVGNDPKMAHPPHCPASMRKILSDTEDRDGR